MSVKPKKRLVGWSVYLQTLCKGAALRGFAGFSGCAGGILLLVAVVSLIKVTVLHQAHNQSMSDFIYALVGCGGIGLLGLFLSSLLFREAKAMQPVVPITRHNTGQLPEVETLVRSSDRPPTAEQTELLRAAGQGAETPPEQLLRATREKRQDV